LLIKSIDDNGEDQFWLYSLKENGSAILNGVIGSPVLWLTDGRLIYEANDGLWSARLNLPKAGYTSEQISVTEHVSLLSFDSTVAQRWSFPSPNLESIVLYDGTNDNDRKWWLVQPNRALINVGKPFYSIGTCCAWARDGRHFAFFSGEPELSLYLVDKDGTNLRQVITARNVGDGVFVSMDFSPDSQTIAFEWSTRGDGFPFDNTQIYLVNSDGSGLRNLTPNSAPHRWLRWSPNGKYIAYLGEQSEVWVAQVTTGNP
jgi:dipeptidyl aminopeptidase/acylaminoacyl peptidase